MSPNQIEHDPALALGLFLAIYGSMLVLASVLTLLPAVSRELTPPATRYGSLDGLRGLLALGVMTHHSFAAFVYYTGAQWSFSASTILNHLGQTTVALFFMITGFLFTARVAREKVNWPALYLGRAARLTPLYVIVMLILFVAVLRLSNWTLKEPAYVVAQELFQWLSFCVFGRPDINGYSSTWTLIAGVNWTLAYEWIFYVLILPVIYLFARNVRATAMAVASTLIFLALLLYSAVVGDVPYVYYAHFFCGVGSAFIFMTPAGNKIVSSPYLKAAALSGLVLLLALGIEGTGPLMLLVTTLLFLSFVGGLSLFGLLETAPAIWLGDVSYGVYLLHGGALSTAYLLLRSADGLTGLQLPAFFCLVVLLAAVVVTLASVSYVFLERPVVRVSKVFSARHFFRQKSAVDETLAHTIISSS